MSYEDLLTKIYNELPQLKGQLHTPHVVYVLSLIHILLIERRG